MGYLLNMLYVGSALTVFNSHHAAENVDHHAVGALFFSLIPCYHGNKPALLCIKLNSVENAPINDLVFNQTDG